MVSISATINLAISKCVCAVVLWICSFLGAYAPSLLAFGDGIAGHGNGGTDMHHHSGHIVCNHGTFMGILNCCSAGLLVGLALFHFYGESTMTFFCQSLAADNVTISSGSPKAEAAFISKLDHAHNVAALLMLCGMLFPPLFERSMCRNRNGLSHHGSAEDCDSAESAAGGGAASAARTVLINTPQVRVIDASNSDVKQHTFSSSLPPASRANPVLFIATLLSVHGAIEGAALGAEPTTSALRAAIIPMALHKFFDGLIFGVRLAKQEGGKAGVQRLVLAFVSVTPVAMMVSALACSMFCQSATAAEVPSARSISNNPCQGGTGGVTAALQGITAGSFLFIALSEILPEEFAVRASRGLIHVFTKVAACVAGALLSLVLQEH